MKFEGIYTPVVTPYDSNYSIEKDVFADILEFLIDAGVHGIVIAGTTGEYYAQTSDERVEMMKFAKSVIGTRVPMIVGTGAIRTEDSVFYAAQAKKAGADALLVTTPPYACPTGREIALHCLDTQRAATLPVILYNYPGRMSVNMDEETLTTLTQNSKFCAIKESSGDPNRLHMLAHDFPQLQIACGMDDQALEFFAWGASSWVCAGANFAPEEHIALYETCVLDGDFNKGRKIMNAMLPLMRVLEQGGKFVQSIKHGVKLRGIDCGPPRKPLRDLTQEEADELTAVIQKMNADFQNITRSK